MSFIDIDLCRELYYPDDPAPATVAAIRSRLAGQWECIASGERWGEGLPDAIRDILDGPLAWRKLPDVVLRGLNGEAAWIEPWDRSDGRYWTLSPLGREKLGRRPVGLYARQRWALARAGDTDALCEARSGDPAFTREGWPPTVYAGGPMPLYRWGIDRDASVAIHQPFAIVDLDKIAAEDQSKVFTRSAKPDPIADRIRSVVR